MKGEVSAEVPGRHAGPGPRALLPEKDRQAALWGVIGGPGALPADGEIAGVWRARKAGKSRLEVTITLFEPLSAAVRTSVRDEAGHVAAARGATDVHVLFRE